MFSKCQQSHHFGLVGELTQMHTENGMDIMTFHLSLICHLVVMNSALTSGNHNPVLDNQTASICMDATVVSFKASS